MYVHGGSGGPTSKPAPAFDSHFDLDGRKQEGATRGGVKTGAQNHYWPLEVVTPQALGPWIDIACGGRSLL